MLKELHVEAFLTCHALPFFSFLQPYEGSKGCEACCPHFEQTMQLRVQRMKLKLSMQSNMRQWCLRITQDTIEAHVHPRKYMLVYAHASACMHSMGDTMFQSTHTYTHTHIHLPSHCFSFSPSCPINKTTHISSQHIIRIERRYFCMLQLIPLSLQSPNKET